ncbi:MAG: hypothetical protein R3E68_07795 [Burkholderiaceae bacterium]
MRPIGFSGKTFKRLPQDLQACIMSSGKTVGAYGREIESSQDSPSSRRWRRKAS